MPVEAQIVWIISFALLKFSYSPGPPQDVDMHNPYGYRNLYGVVVSLESLCVQRASGLIAPKFPSGYFKLMRTAPYVPCANH